MCAHGGRPFAFRRLQQERGSMLTSAAACNQSWWLGTVLRSPAQHTTSQIKRRKPWCWPFLLRLGACQHKLCSCFAGTALWLTSGALDPTEHGWYTDLLLDHARSFSQFLQEVVRGIARLNKLKNVPAHEHHFRTHTALQTDP